jgi:hypothetical protein
MYDSPVVGDCLGSRDELAALVLPADPFGGLVRLEACRGPSAGGQNL